MHSRALVPCHLRQHQHIHVGDTASVETQTLFARLLYGVALVQALQDILHPTFYADIEVVDAQFAQVFQVIVRLSHDVSYGRIHRDGLTFGQIALYEFDDWLQSSEGEREGVGTDEIDSLGRPACVPGTTVSIDMFTIVGCSPSYSFAVA